jgi:hypothetical protein
MKSRTASYLFLLLATLPRYASSVEICLTSSFSEDGCQTHTISCSFSEDSIRLLKNYEDESTTSIIKEPSTQRHSKLSVNPSNFGSVQLPLSNSIFTKHLYTCSGISLINPACGYASLMHYMQNSPTNTVNLLVQDYEKSCKEHKPLAILMLSSVATYFQSLEMPSIERSFVI